MARDLNNWAQGNQLPVMAGILAVGLVLSTVLAGNALWRVKRLDQSSLAVTGYAVQQVNSDKALWELTVSSTGGSRESAYAALNKDFDTVYRFLISHGLTVPEVTAGSITVNPVYERLSNGSTSNTITGYEMSKTIKASSVNVATVTKLTTDVEMLLQQGVAFTVEPPQYLYTQLESKKIEMLAKATENAKARAARMASASSNHIGPLLSASSGVFQISPVDSTEVSDYGMNDTSTVNKDIRAVVNATFMIE